MKNFAWVIWSNMYCLSISFTPIKGLIILAINEDINRVRFTIIVIYWGYITIFNRYQRPPKHSCWSITHFSTQTHNFNKINSVRQSHTHGRYLCFIIPLKPSINSQATSRELVFGSRWMAVYIMHVCKGQGPPSASDIHVYNESDTLVVAGRWVLRVSWQKVNWLGPVEMNN